MSNFEWNGDDIMERLRGAMSRGLNTALIDLLEKTQDLSRVDTGKTRNSYEHSMEWDGSVLIGTLGSNEMNAIYEEFGTGKYAENNDGRQGGWYYFDEKSGQVFFTEGKKQNKPMRDALAVKQADIERHIMDSIEGEF